MHLGVPHWTVKENILHMDIPKDTFSMGYHSGVSLLKKQWAGFRIHNLKGITERVTF